MARTIPERLLRALKTIDRPGSFCASGSGPAPLAVHPRSAVRSTHASNRAGPRWGLAPGVSSRLSKDAPK